MKIIVFGGGYRGQEIIKKIKEGTKEGADIIAVADNYLSGECLGIPIIKPEQVLNNDFDYIVLATQMVDEAIDQLVNIGVDYYKINCSFLIKTGIGGREIFLRHIAEELYMKDINGCVAEAGVLRGEFAKLINECFPDRKLYLFDTFEGFDNRDIEKENEEAEGIKNDNYYKSTTEKLVLSKMVHPEIVKTVKGYVPDTLFGINEQFCFVNLDMDLYQPTKAALRWFWPRMVTGGGILVHDYYNHKDFPNLKYAVREFCEESGIYFFPIADGMSVYIPKI